jgi:hypothetical protein
MWWQAEAGAVLMIRGVSLFLTGFLLTMRVSIQISP